MSRFGIIKIGGVEYDLDDLTLDEVELVEETAGGVPFSEINYGSAKGMKAFTYVLMKRSNPEITYEEVGAVKIINFGQPDEDMPDLPPAQSATPAADASPNGSEVVDSGAPESVASTSGSPPGTSAD